MKSKVTPEALARLERLVGFVRKASIAWLVETHILSDLHYLRSWNARLSEPEWTARNDEAWRFARREDADKALVYLAGGNGRVAQHIWTEAGETLARACVLCDGAGNDGNEKIGDVDCHGCGGTGRGLPSLRDELAEIIRWRFKSADGKPLDGAGTLKHAQEIADALLCNGCAEPVHGRCADCGHLTTGQNHVCLPLPDRKALAPLPTPGAAPADGTGVSQC